VEFGNGSHLHSETEQKENDPTLKKNLNKAPAGRPQSADRLRLTLLILASAATLILACTKVRKHGDNSMHTRAATVLAPSFSLSSQKGSSAALTSYAIDHTWNGVPQEMAGGIDAAVNWENGACSWFRGDHLSTLNLHSLPESESGLHRICSTGEAENQFWPGLPLPENEKLDAALLWDANTAYFFHGDSFSCLNLKSGRFQQSLPLATTSNFNPWRNLPEGFRGDLDAVVNDGLGNILIFKDAQFLRYDRYLQQVVEGPAQIASQWPGLPREFHEGVDAAMRRGRGKVTLFHDGLNVEVITSEAL
jgi:hypothetical protein